MRSLRELVSQVGESSSSSTRRRSSSSPESVGPSRVEHLGCPRHRTRRVVASSWANANARMRRHATCKRVSSSVTVVLPTLRDFAGVFGGAEPSFGHKRSLLPDSRRASPAACAAWRRKPTVPMLERERDLLLCGL